MVLLLLFWLNAAKKEENKMTDRNKQIPVKYSESEYQYIIGEAEKRGVSRSEFIRRKVMGESNDITFTKEFREYLESISEIAVRLQETTDKKQKANAEELLQKMGELWLFLNK